MKAQGNATYKLKRLRFLIAGILALASIFSSASIDATSLQAGATQVDMQIEAGFSFTCLMREGGVSCVGGNWYSQLGDESPESSLTPVQTISKGSGVEAISSGAYNSCAIVHGAARCWGSNAFGQLGNGTTTNSASPVQAIGLTSQVTSISVGTFHTCAVARGAAKCWGSNTFGQLGNGTTTDSVEPVTVLGLDTGVTAISVGTEFSCALVAGTVKCWGSNYGETPVDITSLGSNVNALDAGSHHACALVEGNVNCWGANSYGQLGAATPDDWTNPVLVDGLSGQASSISAGDSGTCAIVLGRLLCWGSNYYGQLGNGTTIDSAVPVSAVGLEIGVTSVSVGANHLCALTLNEVKCWGQNNEGQLGDGTAYVVTRPVQIKGVDSGATAVATGYSSSCATINEISSCWGTGLMGFISSISDRNAVPAGQGNFNTGRLESGLTQLSRGPNHTCEVVSGAAKCSGYNGNGQLGDGTTADSEEPVQVIGLETGVTQISAGFMHSCAVVSGGVKCWGYNEFGGLGNGTTTNSSKPVEAIPANSGVTAVVAGFEHSCALVSRSVRCWGHNDLGQLGYIADKLTPTEAIVFSDSLASTFSSLAGVRVNSGPTPDSKMASIPAGLNTAIVPATSSLPRVTLNFEATSVAATATIAPIANPVAESATPFTITGITKIVDILITGVTGAVTVCLDGASTDQIFHFTGGVWVALPQRTYANGQVCGVTESFSPFAAAQAVVLPPTTPAAAVVDSYKGPLIGGRLSKTVTTLGNSEFTITGERMSQVTSVSLDGKPLTIVSKSDSHLVVQTPAHSAGFIDLVLKSESVSLTFQDAFEYKAPIAAGMPVTASKTLLISSSNAKSLTLAQRKAVVSYVNGAEYGAVLTCSATYVSKGDAANAKALATEACASAKKANSGLATRVAAPVLVKSKAARKLLLSLTD
jgi:alpha-tubulin suppressor-like RCC1 family protein